MQLLKGQKVDVTKGRRLSGLSCISDGKLRTCL